MGQKRIVPLLGLLAFKPVIFGGGRPPLLTVRSGAGNTESGVQ